MRTIHTFVLRILHDSADPQRLQGMVTAAATGDQAPFTDHVGLLDFLRRIGAAEDAGRGHCPRSVVAEQECSKSSPGD